MIGGLRRALSAAFGREEPEKAPREDEHETDAGRRIEAARRRLKKAIAPHED